MVYYTGVGSRNTPDDVLALMYAIAIKMQSLGYILRSGGAAGADKAFELGTGPNKQIFYAKDCTPEAMAIAAQFHPAWHKCSDYIRKLHGRNSFQVLGPNLNDPSKRCICWTPDGATTHIERSYTTGGTGTTISIADEYKVPVVNLAIPNHRQVWLDWVKTT